MMPGMIAARTLTDGGQQPRRDRARASPTSSAQAQTSLDIALYDLNLGPETEAVVIGAIEAAAKRGVAVRLAYNVDFRAPIPVPPPPTARPEDIERLERADARDPRASPT